MIAGNSFGDERPVARFKTSTVKYIDDGGKPFLTYEFRYRSLRQYILFAPMRYMLNTLYRSSEGPAYHSDEPLLNFSQRTASRRAHSRGAAGNRQTTKSTVLHKTSYISAQY